MLLFSLKIFFININLIKVFINLISYILYLRNTRFIYIIYLKRIIRLI